MTFYWPWHAFKVLVLWPWHVFKILVLWPWYVFKVLVLWPWHDLDMCLKFLCYDLDMCLKLFYWPWHVFKVLELSGFSLIVFLKIGIKNFFFFNFLGNEETYKTILRALSHDNTKWLFVQCRVLLIFSELILIDVTKAEDFTNSNWRNKSSRFLKTIFKIVRAKQSIWSF